MELKWLEDFLSLARTRNFTRAAEERHVTQSAFSRRIQALESWLGVELIDRSTYPTTLTEAGNRFLETAEETVHRLHDSRLELQAKARPSAGTVSVAALHTLALGFFPRWFKAIEHTVGPLHSRLLPDDFHNCVQALVEGGYDFLLTFHHANVPVPLDADAFPYQVVGQDAFVAVRRPVAPGVEADVPPLLAYAPNSFLGRVAASAQDQAGMAPPRVVHVNENAMAESLKHMALEGHGMAWLPRSLVAEELSQGRLVTLGATIPLEVRLYRNARRTRQVVEAVWSAALDLSAQGDAQAE